MIEASLQRSFLRSEFLRSEKKSQGPTATQHAVADAESKKGIAAASLTVAPLQPRRG